MILPLDTNVSCLGHWHGPRCHSWFSWNYVTSDKRNRVLWKHFYVEVIEYLCGTVAFWFIIWLNCLCSGILEINCSKDVKVQGIIGPCTSLEKVWHYGHWIATSLFRHTTSCACFSVISNIAVMSHRKVLCLQTLLLVKETLALGKCAVLTKKHHFALYMTLQKKMAKIQLVNQQAISSTFNS